MNHPRLLRRSRNSDQHRQKTRKKRPLPAANGRNAQVSRRKIGTERHPLERILTECSDATVIGPGSLRNIDCYFAIHSSPPDDSGLPDQVLPTLGDANPAVILAPTPTHNVDDSLFAHSRYLRSSRKAAPWKSPCSATSIP